MPLYADVVATLNAAAMDSRTHNFWNHAGLTPVRPYTVLATVAGVPENTLGSGVIKTNTRLQIDAYATTYPGAQTLAAQVMAAMAAASFSNVLLQSQDFYEDEVSLHRVSMDFSIWS